MADGASRARGQLSATPAALDEPALLALAADVNAAHRACEAATRTAVAHALGAGRLLLRAKAALPHGAWLPWLRAHVACAERTAQLYMRLARDWPPPEAQRVADSPPAGVPLRELAWGTPDGAGGDEWYTPPPYVEAARGLLGGIDLDPASCPAAQRVVRAARAYGKAEDGLARPWLGRVWLNPPYSRAGAFAAKLAAEHDAGRLRAAVALVNASTDAGWFMALAGRYPVLFTRGRVRFWRPDRGGEAPPSGQALFGVGVEVAAFAAAFAGLAYAPNRF